MSYVVGLTGGIGSGKSTIGAQFEALGAGLIDADAVSHALTRKDARGAQAIREAFGPAYFDPEGDLDRARLRETVFADPSQRRRLERILHPLIRDEIAMLLERSVAPYTLLMVPLLLEGGRQPDRYRRVLVVDCLESTQVARVVARSGIAAEQVRAIIAAQIPRTRRLALADDIIDNEGLPGASRDAVLRLDRLYRGLARR
jgi:dephospho-CoA kinase